MDRKICTQIQPGVKPSELESIVVPEDHQIITALNISIAKTLLTKPRRTQ
jgi:hypothetical protein